MGERFDLCTRPARRCRPRVILVAGLALMTLGATSAARGGTSNSLMDISVDGRLMACSNRDAGSVSLIDLETNQRLHVIPVGNKPEGVTFLGNSRRLAVAVYGDDEVVLIDGERGVVTGRVAVFDEPYGVVSSRDGDRIYVTLDYPGQLVEIDVPAQQVARSTPVGKFVRGLAMDESAGRIYATEFYTTAILSIDLEKWAVVDRWMGASTDNLARQITLHPSRPKAYLPNIRSRVKAVHGEGSIFPYLTVADTGETDERRRKRIPMDAFLGNRVTANPWEVAVSPNGQQLAIVFAGTNDMFFCKVLDDNYREVAYQRLVSLGNNPRAVRFSADNRRCYVYNALDFAVVVYDTATFRKLSTISVCDNPLADDVHQGKILFYSALQPMVGRRWISCASCHPDGEPDGRTWHNPEGLRNTQSLAGMAATHPIHWSADRDEVQDFEHTIRGPLMQGRGLIRGRVNDSLGPPNAGRSTQLDALAAYANSHKLALSPHAKNGLTESAQRGRDLFFSAETRCASCHSGAYYTDSRPGPAESLVRHDVGTGEDDPSEKMGPKYDTPSLLGVYRTAPYLHHGAAETLEEVLTTENPNDRHGKTSHLSSAQAADLVAFLKSLPYQSDPSATKSDEGAE